MDEQIEDIVALVTESGTKTRRERAAFVAKLRDEMGLTFKEIGRQINVTHQRAQQLYGLHKYFSRSANSPFAMSARARTFLNNVASWMRLGPDWEQNPAAIARLVHRLTNMSEQEAFKFRQLGRKTYQEVVDFMKEHGVKFPYQSMGEGLGDEMGAKDLTPGFNIQQAIQAITQFFVDKGYAREFKLWPPGSYTGPYAENAEFVITLGEFLADAWEEHWGVVDEFDALVKSLALHYEMATRSVITFYHDPWFDEDSLTPPPQANDTPPSPNLKDVTFD